MKFVIVLVAGIAFLLNTIANSQTVEQRPSDVTKQESDSAEGKPTVDQGLKKHGSKNQDPKSESAIDQAESPKIAVMETAFNKRADVTSIADAKAAGYNAIQMHTGLPAGFKKKPWDQSLGLPIGSDPSILKSWQTESAKHGVKIISLCAGSLNKCQIWDKDREIAMRIAKETIDGCHTLGINVMLFPFFGPSNFQTDDEALNGVADFMTELLPYAKEKNVIIGIEAPVTTVRVMELIEKLNYPEHLKIYYDTGNLFEKENIYETIQKYGKDHFCEVHIKAAGSSVAGLGQIDLGLLAKSLDDAEYQDWLVYEANRDGKDPIENRKAIEKIISLRKKTEPSATPADSKK